jgi:hypothetical protein
MTPAGASIPLVIFVEGTSKMIAPAKGGGGGGTSGNNNPLYPSPTNPTPSNPNAPQEPGLVNPDGTGTIVSEPVIPVSMVRVLGLNLAQKAWWNAVANAEAVGIITDYWNESDKDIETREISKRIIDYLIQNPQQEYTNENYPGIGNMPFKWWEDDVYIKQNFTIFEQLPNAFEIILFNLFPEKALLHVNNSLTALNKAQELFLDGTLPGIEDGKADAFRHAYWNALDTSEFGSELTKVFTDAHEAFSSGLPKQMDLHNNLKGREKAEIMNFNFFTNDSDISSSILIEVYIGHLVYINNGVLIPTN